MVQLGAPELIRFHLAISMVLHLDRVTCCTLRADERESRLICWPGWIPLAKQFIGFPSDGGSHILGREHGEVMGQLREVWFFFLTSFIVGS